MVVGDDDLSVTMDAGTVASAATTAALLGGDLKRVFKPQLRELRAKMQRQTSEHTRHALELAEATAGAEEQRGELTRSVETVRGRACGWVCARAGHHVYPPDTHRG